MNTLVETLNAGGSSFVQFAWPMLLQSAVVVAVLLSLNWALHRHVRAVVRYALLLLMLVKLVLPPSFALPTGAGNWLSLDHTPLAQVPAEVPAGPSAVAPAEAIVPMRDLASLTSPKSSPPQARASLSWQAVLFVGWVAGMTVLMGLVVRRFRYVARLVGSAEEAPTGLQEMLEFCRAKLGIRQPVVLRFSAFPSSPAVCGLLRPVILVPKGLAESFSAEELQAVLLHELGHIKRGDLWVSHVQTLLQILYWYNPVLWAGNAIMRHVREEAVDELVMVKMESQADTYPGTLLAVAKLGFMRRLAGLGLVGIAESRRGLKTRIQRLVSGPIPVTAKLGVLGVLIFSIVASVVLPLATSVGVDVSFVLYSADTRGIRAGLYRIPNDSDRCLALLRIDNHSTRWLLYSQGRIQLRSGDEWFADTNQLPTVWNPPLIKAGASASVWVPVPSGMGTWRCRIILTDIRHRSSWQEYVDLGLSWLGVRDRGSRDYVVMSPEIGR